MISSLSIGPRTLLNDCNHSGTAIFWRSAIPKTGADREQGLHGLFHLWPSMLGGIEYLAGHWCHCFFRGKTIGTAVGGMGSANVYSARMCSVRCARDSLGWPV